jgi:hypothetical protein
MMGHCEFCGAKGPVTEVVYRQNTGLVIMRQTRTWAGSACRTCSVALFRRTTLHNLFLGWWGVISLFMTPIFLAINGYYLSKTLRLPTLTAHNRRALEGQREYAESLLASKDRATVIDVLQRQTGATDAEVQAFLDELRPAPARIASR